jgi:hypothetical protein
MVKQASGLGSYITGNCMICAAHQGLLMCKEMNCQSQQNFLFFSAI